MNIAHEQRALPQFERALVTGAGGFIGRHLCERLRRDGVQVHGVSRVPRSGGATDIAWAQADLRDRDATKRLLAEAEPDVVFHLGGWVSGQRDVDAVWPALWDILVASVNVMTAAVEAGGVPVMLAGSMEEPLAIATEPVPSSPYAAGKHAVAGFARMLHALHDLPVAHLRIFMVYGPGQEDCTKLVPYVVTSLLRGKSPKLSTGARAVDWVYVSDVVDALVAAARTPDAAGATLDVGSGELITIRSLVERIAGLVRANVRPQFGAVPDRPLETERAADIAATYRRIGWRPTTSLEDGLQTTVDHYRSLFRSEAS